MSRPHLLVVLTVAAGLAAAAALALFTRIEITRLPPEVERSYRTPGGDPLFHSADAFYHLRWTQRSLGDGGGEARTEGDPEGWDRLSFAPDGRRAVPSLLQPLQAWAWRLWPGDASPATVAFYLPAASSVLLLALLAVIAARLAARPGAAPAAAAPAAAVATALVAAAHPELVSHTHAGMADTTHLSLILYSSVVAVLLPLGDALGPGAWRRVAGWSLALAALLALFAATWAGWWAAALTAVAFLVPRGFAALWAAAGRPRIRWLLAAGGLIALAAVAAIFLGTGAPGRLARYTGFKRLGIFPDGATQVQELSSLTPAGLLSHLGGWPLVTLAAVGLVWMLVLRRRRWAALLLLLWALPAIVAGAYALRFAVFAVPALAVAAGWAAARLAAAATAGAPWVVRRPAVRALTAAAVAAALTVAAGWGWRDDLRQLSDRRPAIDRAFAEIAETIHSRSPPGALINSWWDHGYALTQLSGRGAVLDGGTYQSQRLYWMSLVLTSGVPPLSHNVLRAIDCGAEEEVFETLRAEVPAERAIGLLRRAFRRPGVDGVGRALLANGVTSETVQTIYALLDCDPPPAWLVVSSDLAAKTTSWAAFGRWRFDGEEPSPEPRISSPVPCQLIAGELECANGYRARLERDGFTDRSTPDHFAAVGPVRPDGLVPVLHQHGRGLLLTFVRHELIDSLFVRLYYFQESDERFRLERVAHHPPHTERVLLYRIGW